MPIPGQRVRVGGSGFTVFHWDDGTGDKVIGFAREVRVAGVQPVAAPEVIQPLNAARPVEIATPGAHAEGTLTLVLTELYNQAIWQRLGVVANSNDIIDVMRTVAALDNGIKVSRIVNPPKGLGRGSYMETYNECVITRVQDDETINIATMAIHKEVDLMYTYQRKHWIKSPRTVENIFV